MVLQPSNSQVQQRSIHEIGPVVSFFNFMDWWSDDPTVHDCWHYLHVKPRIKTLFDFAQVYTCWLQQYTQQFGCF